MTTMTIPSFLQITTPLTDEGYRELMSVQKDFEVIDEEMWKCGWRRARLSMVRISRRATRISGTFRC